ncbi:glutamyl-tRNA reductase [Petralouisia muris]|uniref:Glutamyl-tRNA reductase n=1 Tax=Petralouisia muris TaxID=3032872 RepID=A0AC61S0L4_9FIRM|nr:glutamyl-tRNA reductase [Petralouisia muris]TGY97691.1 glutamyl-tRNA reductase [Petralouisia muris]
MQFGFLGINYRNAQLAVRDRTSFTDAMKLELFQKAEEAGVDQCMVLSTCNRSEVYYVYERKEQQAQMQRIYEGMFPEVELQEFLMKLSGNEAMAWLFRIAAGLESLVLGEDQILGQVKEALDFSRTMGYSKKELNRIVRDAITCAKQIKTELKISEKPLSVSYIGIKKLEEACGVSGKKILVIGSGKTAALALKYIYEYSGVRVTACSRTYAHARNLREQFPQLEIISYEDWRQAVGDCDIVISATSSPHLVVRREDFTPARPVTLLDLAAPRDIDISFAQDPLATLINLDTLQAIAGENQKERERLVEESRKLIGEKLQETQIWLLQSRMDSTIESLQQRCSGIEEDSFRYLNRKMELGAREQKLLKKVLHASLQRLLREPIQELKRLDSEEEQEEYKRLVRQLFQI